MGKRRIRIAVEGCGHGTLNAIYSSIKKTCEIKGWDGVDLLIIGGDFEALRNAYDLNAMVVPQKYREMGDFHEYYSGKRVAPYLTIFIGGNHEASNHLFELFYGGWVAPNIYYLGAANLLRFGPLRIAGQSGIWKGYNYNKPHFERMPFSKDDLRSYYHVREIDTRKLLQIRSQIDIGLSHDWPRSVEWKGDWKALFRRKPFFEAEARDGTLGNTAAEQLLNYLRPFYWFAAHMHDKFAAVIDHGPAKPAQNDVVAQPSNEASANPDEIDLDLSGGEETRLPKVWKTEHKDSTNNLNASVSTVPQNLRQQLPDSFQKHGKTTSSQNAPVPDAIYNHRTRFLALDKCLPGRAFLQFLEVPACEDDGSAERPFQLAYDKEWLAITRVFAPSIIIGDRSAKLPSDKGPDFYRPKIEEEMAWIEENLVKTGRMEVPKNFEITAPVYNPADNPGFNDQGKEYTNPQTSQFCNMLQIPNPFDISEEERRLRMSRGPAPSENRAPRGGHGFGRGGGGRGRGRGRGRGGRS